MRRWTFAAMSLGLSIGLTHVTRAQEVAFVPPAPVSENSQRDETLQLTQAPAKRFAQAPWCDRTVVDLFREDCRPPKRGPSDTRMATKGAKRI